MENIWDLIKESLSNRIQVKRKYTEMYPAKHVGRDARVRNEIIKYIGSNNIVSIDEFEHLISTKSNNSLIWKKKNQHLFEKDEKGYVKLSKIGRRIFDGLLSYEVAKNKINESERLVGGVGDYKDDDEFDEKELMVGIEVEKEHTDNIEIAKEIAKDHLAEDPQYYSKLIKAGLADEEGAIALAKEIGLI